ncbi:MAG: hypothetical protein ACOYYJ_11900, partial [Chloroflexota bacterium]
GVLPGMESIPGRMKDIPTRMKGILAGMGNIPGRMESIPGGMKDIPSGKNEFPMRLALACTGFANPLKQNHGNPQGAGYFAPGKRNAMRALS